MLQLREEYFPTFNFPNDRFAMMMAFAYSHVGDQVKSYEILCDVFDYYHQQLIYAKGMPQNKSFNTDKMLADAAYFLHQTIVMRNHKMIRNPFDVYGRSEVPLTEEGEKIFVSADTKNAERLKAIDEFANSSEYQNEVIPLVNSMR